MAMMAKEGEVVIFHQTAFAPDALGVELVVSRITDNYIICEKPGGNEEQWFDKNGVHINQAGWIEVRSASIGQSEGVA